LAVTLLVALSGCGFEVVDEGYRGIYKYNGAVQGEPLSPGLHFYNPLFAGITEFDVMERKQEGESMAFTADTQNVIIKYAVTYYPDQKAVNQIFSQFGWEWETKLVPNAVLGSIKDVIGQYTADTLVSKRERATRDAEAEIKKTLAERKIIVTRLDITNLDFDDAYEKAVEAKVTAVQNAIAEKNKTVQIQEQANQTVATAKADAEAMRIKSQALSQNKGLVQFEAVQKWDGVLPQIILGGQSMPILDLKALSSGDK
jgi:regulator of protease activity HflC (stomatin/prohibitin superfamily)